MYITCTPTVRRILIALALALALFALQGVGPGMDDPLSAASRALK